MTYLIVIAIVVLRVFGFKKTMDWFNRLFSRVQSSTSETVWAAVANADKSRSALEKQQSYNKLRSQLAAAATGLGTLKNNRAGAAKAVMRSRRGLIHNSGRTTEEILASKPDFGWRRIS